MVTNMICHVTKAKASDTEKFPSGEAWVYVIAQDGKKIYADYTRRSYEEACKLGNEWIKNQDK